MRRLLVGFGGTVLGLWYTEKNHPDYLSKVNLFRDVRSAVTVVTIAADYKLSLLFSDPTSEHYLKELSVVHDRSAHRLKRLIFKNKGCYIKFGQIISSLQNFVPEEYVEVMSCMQDNAPKTSIEELFQTINDDFGRPDMASELFTDFEPEPLGAASIAQVHRAKLRSTNETVAVKIQHPRVQSQFLWDLKVSLFAMKTMARIFPDFRLDFIGEEASKKIPVELDFRVEARNCDVMSEIMKDKPYVRIPKVHREFSTSRVLTMEYCPGCRVDDHQYIKDNNINPVEVAEKLGEMFSSMIFDSGVVHCDPHPGNLKLSMDPKNGLTITLLDNALIQTYDEQFRYDYGTFCRSLMKGDENQIEICAKRLGVDNMHQVLAVIVSGRSWESINKGLVTGVATEQELKKLAKDAPEYLRETAEVLRKIPPEMLMLLRTNRLLDAVEHRLKVKTGRHLSFIPMYRQCIRSMARFERNQRPMDLLFWARSWFEENLSLLVIQIYCYYVRTVSVLLN